MSQELTPIQGLKTAPSSASLEGEPPLKKLRPDGPSGLEKRVENVATPAIAGVQEQNTTSVTSPISRDFLQLTDSTDDLLDLPEGWLDILSGLNSISDRVESEEHVLPGSPLTDLPAELLLQIFSDLNSISDMARLSQTCKQLYHISKDPHLPLVDYPPDIMNKKYAYKMVGSSLADDITMINPDFNETKRIKKLNHIKSKRVRSFIAIENYLFMAFNNGWIKIQDIESDTSLVLFKAHNFKKDRRIFISDSFEREDRVHLAVHENRLVTGAKDEVKLWNISDIKKPECIWTHKLNLGNDQTLRDLQIDKNRLIIISKSGLPTHNDRSRAAKYTQKCGKIEIFNLESETPVSDHSIQQEDLFEAPFQIDGNQLFIAKKGEDKRHVISIYDIKSEELIKTLTISEKIGSSSLNPWYSFILVSGNRVITLARSGEIKMWDIESEKVLYEFEMPELEDPFNPFFSDFYLNGKYLFGRGRYNTLIVWNIESGKRLQTFYGQMRFNGLRTHPLQVHEGRWITPCPSSKLSIWKFGTSQTFSMKVLEDNLAMVKQLAVYQNSIDQYYLDMVTHTPIYKSPSGITYPLAEKIRKALDNLDPYFKELWFDINQNALHAIQKLQPSKNTFSVFHNNVSYLLSMICAEILGCAIRDNNREKVDEMASILDQAGYGNFFLMLPLELYDNPAGATEEERLKALDKLRSNIRAAFYK